MAAQSLTTQRRWPTSSSLLASALLGALSCLLCVIFWALLAAMLSQFNVRVPLGVALLLGAVLGVISSIINSVIGSVIHSRQASTTRIIMPLIGVLMALAWLQLTNDDPLGFGRYSATWGVLAACVSVGASGFLVAYGMRELNLTRPQQDTFEVMVIRVLRGFGFAFFLTIVIFPFYFMVVSSLKSRAIFLQDPSNLAVDFSQGLAEFFVGYVEVLVRFNFARYILNSTFVAIATVVITLVVAVFGAYAVTRLRFPGRTLVSRAILLIYMFPAIVLVVPLYSVFTRLQLRDALLGLLIVYPAQTIPVALYMLRSYFQTLPKDLEEAGMIDGCNRFEVIWRITLPLSIPALASVGLYVFMIAWNEFLFAFMFLDSPTIFTLSRGMVALNSQEVPRQFLMAGAVIVTVPIMVLFFWFEKYLVGGLTAGGVKE